jgi:hypothetical protein
MSDSRYFLKVAGYPESSVGVDNPCGSPRCGSWIKRSDLDAHSSRYLSYPEDGERLVVKVYPAPKKQG